MKSDRKALADWLTTRITILEMLGRTNRGVLTADDANVLTSYRLALSALQDGQPVQSGHDAVAPEWSSERLVKQIMADGAERVAVHIRACLDEFPTASHDIVEECAMCASETAQKLRAGL